MKADQAAVPALDDLENLGGGAIEAVGGGEQDSEFGVTAGRADGARQGRLGIEGSRIGGSRIGGRRIGGSGRRIGYAACSESSFRPIR